MKENKKIIFALLLTFLMGIEALIANKIYFPELDVWASGTFIIILNVCFWGSIFFLPKIVVWLALLIQMLLSIGLLVYHNYFINPLTLSIIYYQYKEGREFLAKVPLVLLNYKTIIVIIVGLLNFYLYHKLSPLLKGFRKGFFIFFIPFVLMMTVVLNVPKTFFSSSYFNDACKNFGYRACWSYELMIKERRAGILQQIIQVSNDQPSKMVELPRVQHIYIIQTESLVYDVFNRKINEAELTPFLNKIAKQGVLFEVVQRVHGASANTDFFVNSGGYSEREFTIIYNMFKPSDIYPHLTTLPQKAKKLGYQTNFYHNFKGHFFDRETHIPAQGYQNVYFYDEMKTTYPDDGWGISDGDMFDFISKNDKKLNQLQSLDFIITVSSHSDYKVLGNPSPFFAKPKSTLEDYYNAINYVDNSLQQLVKSSPPDSLFIIYGDHGVGEFKFFNIPLLIYAKDQKLNLASEKISMQEMISIIHGLFTTPEDLQLREQRRLLHQQRKKV